MESLKSQISLIDLWFISFSKWLMKETPQILQPTQQKVQPPISRNLDIFLVQGVQRF